MQATRLHDLSLLALRLAFGGLMFFNHGLGKLEKLMGPGPIQWADPLGIGPGMSLALATGAEVGAAALLALGLFTRLAAVPLMITMAVAAFIVHGADPFAKKEAALLFFAAYLAVFLQGPGRYSVGQLLANKLPSGGWKGFWLR